ncbi:MAG: hypothetical protein V7607_1717 [Solirubrobacteraceae bacterium]
MRTCVIGAGAAGIASARALQAAHVSFDWFERTNAIGGNWRSGVYDSTHLISSRSTSGFPDLPMPRAYPNFPGRVQVLRYLEAYAEHFGLTDQATLGVEVRRVRSEDPRRPAAWQAELSTGDRRRYDAVIVTNGHLWDARVPQYPGTFAGKTLHSRNYRAPADLDGDRVLVVGAGNSACDIAVEAAQAGKEVLLSVRRGHWFIPKSLFGVPRGELRLQRLPAPLRQLALGSLSRVALGRNERYGLPVPDHSLGAEPPIISSQLFYSIDHGAITPRPAIERLQGDRVRFVDGAVEAVDTIVWATGYRVSFPFLDSELLRWRDGIPERVAAGTLTPDVCGLYFVGLVTPGGGNFPVHHAQARLVADLIATQATSTVPLSMSIFPRERPDARMYFSVDELLRQVRAAQRKVARNNGRQRAPGSAIAQARIWRPMLRRRP